LNEFIEENVNEKP